jgi:hypothetical protein
MLQEVNLEFAGRAESAIRTPGALHQFYLRFSLAGVHRGGWWDERRTPRRRRPSRKGRNSGSLCRLPSPRSSARAPRSPGGRRCPGYRIPGCAGADPRSGRSAIPAGVRRVPARDGRGTIRASRRRRRSADHRPRPPAAVVAICAVSRMP